MISTTVQELPPFSHSFPYEWTVEFYKFSTYSSREGKPRYIHENKEFIV